MSSSSPVKTRISTNQLQAVRNCLGNGFEWDNDENSFLLINKTTKHPTGFKITNEKMVAVNKHPLDAQACEKMLKAGVELYGNELVVYAPTEAEKKHMLEAAEKLQIKCTVTTSKEEHQRLMDEHAKNKAVTPPQPLANNGEKASSKKVDIPSQTNSSSETLDSSQRDNKSEADTELETIEEQGSSIRKRR